MAIEAQQINLLPYQLLLDNRDCINTKNRILSNLYDTHQMESALLPLATTVPETTLVPFYQSSVCDLAHATKASLKSDSGLTYNNVNNIPVPRKRTRDTFDELNNAFINVVPQKHPKMSTFMDQDLALFQIQQQQQNSEITNIIEEHTRKMKFDIEEMVKQQSKLLISLASREIMNKLKQKEQEIERLVKLNWMLQERVRTLCMENQIWRGLAQTNEATANSLRTNLEQVLAHVSEDRAAPCDAAPAADDDAESCCGSSDHGRECIDTEVNNNNNNKEILAADDQDGTQPQPQHGGGNRGGFNDVRMCKSCGAKESSVLVMPCRHLSLCTGCGSNLHNCPVCSTVITGSVHVNLS